MPRPNKSRKQRTQDRMRYIFKRCALEVDPSGELTHLCAEFAWHPTTIWLWIKNGYMPRPKAELLHSRFSDRVEFKPEELLGSLIEG